MSPFAEAGFSIHEIAASSGHATCAEIARYTMAANQDAHGLGVERRS